MEVNGKFYFIGGRPVSGNLRDVDIWDPTIAEWVENPTNAKFPNHHHFQPVVVGNEIWIANGMTRGFPDEIPLEKIWIYDTITDIYYESDIEISRPRGAGGAVVYQGKLYLISGITNGHLSDTVPWFDSYDINGGLWTQLPDVPHPRDHTNAAVLDGRLYLVGGRESNMAIDNDVFDDVIPEVDVWDFSRNEWLNDQSGPAPAPNFNPARAAAAVVVWRGTLIAFGGEGPDVAHPDVDQYKPSCNCWTELQDMQTGPRHGFGAIVYNDYIFAAGGSPIRGGGNMNDIIVFPETSTTGGSCAT